MGNKQQLNYITGLKGLSCFLIMAGHFSGVFKYLDSCNFNWNLFRFFVESPFGLILNESFWLILFYVTSGFLLSLGKINDLRSLILKIIKRFLRLGIPVFFACAIIYVLILCIGVHCGETVSLFENAWFQSSFRAPLTLSGVFLSPFDVLLFGKCTFNSPYWVLRDMFYNSVLIYFCLYLQAKTEKIRFAKYIIVYAFLLYGLMTSPITCSFAMGMAIAQHDDLIKRIFTPLRLLALPCLAIVVAMFFIHPVFYHEILIFGAVLVTVPYIGFAEQLLSCRPARFLGQISFGIYSFHWPVFCSLGAWLLLFLTSKTGIWTAFAIASFVSVAFTFLLSYVYNITAEKFSTKLVDRITGSISHFLLR